MSITFFQQPPLSPIPVVRSPAADRTDTADRGPRTLQRRRSTVAAVNAVLGENDAGAVSRRRQRPRTAAAAAADGRPEVRAAVPGLRVAAAGQTHMVDGRPTVGHHPRDGT